MNSDSPNRTRRPWWLKLISAGLLLISLWGWLRLEQALYRWEALNAAGIYPGARYVAISGAAIGLTAGVACAAVWWRSRSAPWLSLSVLAGWVIWMWVDRLWIARSPIALDNAPFLLVVSLIILAGSAYAFWKGRRQFR